MKDYRSSPLSKEVVLSGQYDEFLEILSCKTNCRVLFLGQKHFDQIDRLNNQVARYTDESMFYVDNDLIMYCLTVGVGIGIVYEDVLIAYHLLDFAHSPQKNLGSHLHFSEEQLKNTIQLEYLVVHISHENRKHVSHIPHKKHGLGFSLVKCALSIIDELDFKYVTSACHPNNYASVRLHFKWGFSIKSLKHLYDDYGGNLRYIWGKTLHTDEHYQSGNEIVVEHHDISKQKSLLSQGYSGRKMVNFASGHGIAFTR